MKHTLENNPEYIRLANYFKWIETLAEKMGIDVDDFIQESENISSMYTTYNKNKTIVTEMRAKVLSKTLRETYLKDESSLASLSVLRNNKE